MKRTDALDRYCFIPMLLLIMLAACGPEPEAAEQEIVRETVEVPVTVEVTREVMTVQEVEVTRELEVEVEVTRLVTQVVQVTPTERPYLDFSAIEGQWEGEAREAAGRFWVRVTLEPGASYRSKVGTVRYGISGTDAYDCKGDWLALTADHPVYTLYERISGSCPPGNVRLEYNAENGTMSYEFAPISAVPQLEATGVLERSEE